MSIFLVHPSHPLQNMTLRFCQFTAGHRIKNKERPPTPIKYGSLWDSITFGHRVKNKEPSCPTDLLRPSDLLRQLCCTPVGYLLVSIGMRACSNIWQKIPLLNAFQWSKIGNSALLEPTQNSATRQWWHLPFFAPFQRTGKQQLPYQRGKSHLREVEPRNVIWSCDFVISEQNYYGTKRSTKEICSFAHCI